MRSKAPDLIGAVLLMALGAAFSIGTLASYNVMGQGGRIGPGFMPFSAGLLLILFGAMVAVGALLGGRGTEDGADAVDDEAGEPSSPGSRYTVAGVFGLTLVAILLIPVLGFLVSFGLLIFVLVKFVEGKSLLLAAGAGVGGVIFAWFVFVLFLQIPLPGGLFVAGG